MLISLAFLHIRVYFTGSDRPSPFSLCNKQYLINHKEQLPRKQIQSQHDLSVHVWTRKYLSFRNLRWIEYQNINIIKKMLSTLSCYMYRTFDNNVCGCINTLSLFTRKAEWKWFASHLLYDSFSPGTVAVCDVTVWVSRVEDGLTLHARLAQERRGIQSNEGRLEDYKYSSLNTTWMWYQTSVMIYYFLFNMFKYQTVTSSFSILIIPKDSMCLSFSWAFWVSMSFGSAGGDAMLTPRDSFLKAGPRPGTEPRPSCAFRREGVSATLPTLPPLRTVDVCPAVFVALLTKVGPVLSPSMPCALLGTFFDLILALLQWSRVFLQLLSSPWIRCILRASSSGIMYFPFVKFRTWLYQWYQAYLFSRVEQVFGDALITPYTLFLPR